ncbi:MAG: hypothetical protein ACYTHK_14580 [Planctomycetota bacterium]|jgi:hypothetical protein
MRYLALLLLFALPAVAQDAEKLIKQAKRLEARAEKLLDQGKRAEAFDALAKAAELRDKARAQGTAKPKPKEKKKAGKSVKVRKADPAEIAHTELDMALKAGNLEAARMASGKLREARAAQAKRIAALEAQLKGMEKQLDEIRRMLNLEKPG